MISWEFRMHPYSWGKLPIVYHHRTHILHETWVDLKVSSLRTVVVTEDHNRIGSVHRGEVHLTLPCCPQNTTKVVLFLPAMVRFHEAHIIILHDMILVKKT
jgi:hypothetical protein